MRLAPAEARLSALHEMGRHPSSWQGRPRAGGRAPQETGNPLRREGLPWEDTTTHRRPENKAGGGGPFCPYPTLLTPLQAVPPKAKGGLNGAAPEGETDILSQREGEAAGPGPAGKEVAEEEEVAGVPGWEVRRRVGQLECSRHRPTEKPRSTAGWSSWEGGQSWGDGALKTPGPNCHPSGARGPTEPRGSSHGVSQEWV